MMCLFCIYQLWFQAIDLFKRETTDQIKPNKPTPNYDLCVCVSVVYILVNLK